MKLVHSTNEAESDLDIARVALEEWGQEQCAKHLALLELHASASSRSTSRSRALFRAGPHLVRWRCERHVIYVRRVADGIEIVRILHQRMLRERHL